MLLNSERFTVANVSDNTGRTALHIAAEKGNVDFVKLLLDSDRFHAVNNVLRGKWSDPEVEGKTALHLAAEHGHLDVVQALLEHESFTSVAAQTTVFHRTAAQVALRCGHSHISRAIREHLDAPRHPRAAD